MTRDNPMHEVREFSALLEWLEILAAFAFSKSRGEWRMCSYRELLLQGHEIQRREERRGR